MSDDKPQEKPTVQLEQVPPWAVKMTERMIAEFKATNANIDVVSNDLGILKQRVSIIEGLRTEDALRASKYSGGIKGLSQSDEGQNMQIASLSVKLDELAVKTATKDEVSTLLSSQTTAILARFDTVVKSPRVQMLITFVLTAIGTWLASKGIQVPK